MKILNVNILNNNYKIIIGYKILDKISEEINKIFQNYLTKSFFIISDRNVFKLYGENLKNVLKRDGFNDIGSIVFSSGEKSKSWKEYGNILKKIIQFDSGKKKNIIILNLGGGVVGDIGGFVASTYRRGIPYIQIPTTLLACVDSSIGGKVGVDFKVNSKIIKNIIGNFYQPKMVFMDLFYLKTLPKKEILNGLAEIIKYGIIKDKKLFEYTQQHLDKIIDLCPENIEYVVEKSSNIKKIIVEKDEKETKSIRTILNFGHTIGHAIEGAYELRYTHGEAISIGMVVESKISCELGLFKKQQFDKIINLISMSGLPVKLPNNRKTDKIIDVMNYDKKFKSGKNRFVLPVDIGKVIIKENISDNLIRKSIDT